MSAEDDSTDNRALRYRYASVGDPTDSHHPSAHQKVLFTLDDLGDLLWRPGDPGEVDYAVIVRSSGVETRELTGGRPTLLVDAFPVSESFRTALYLDGRRVWAERSDMAGFRELIDQAIRRVRAAASRPAIDPEAKDRSVLDAGPPLLQAITHVEHAAIEKVLGILGEARDAGTLTRWQEDQIILMADLIRAARDEAVPDVTERWNVIGVVGGALRYLARELPEDVVKWGAAGLVLSNIDWHNLAAALAGGG